MSSPQLRAARRNVSYAGRLSQLGLLDGDALVIPAGQNWLNDLTVSPDLGYLTINGTLTTDTTKSTQLKVKGISGASTGAYKLGAAGAGLSVGYTHDLIVNGLVPAGRIIGPTHDSNNVSYNTPNDGGGLNRGIVLQDGFQWEVYGTPPTVTNTTLYDTHALTGATSIRIAGAAYWKAGWKFTLGMTKLLQSMSQTDVTEIYTVASDTVPDASGLFTVINLTSAVTYDRWGKLQYGTGAGMSLTNDGFTAANLVGQVPAYMDATARAAYADAINAAIAAGRENVLDQRAPVSLLTRNVTISAPNDTAFSGDERFGVHLMKMGRTGSLLMDGVEIFNCGQGGALGRYPIHWHMNSINPSTGALLGIVTAGKNAITRCSIHRSKNRGLTFHGVHGATAANNSFHDILGHVIFFEDGSEQYNTVDGNFMSHWRDPGVAATTPAPRGYRIKLHDATPASMWVTNAKNYIRNNRGSDGHTGRWIVVSPQCFGLSASAPIAPSYTNLLEWDNNTHHSCMFQGARVFGSVLDEQGTVNLNVNFQPRDTETSGGVLVVSPFTRERLWKNNGSDQASDVSGNSGVGNYDNRVQKPNYSKWVVADCLGADFSGATDANPANQFSKQHLFVGKSLNVEAKQNSSALSRNGFASYHGSLPFTDNTFINYAAGNIRTGADHYGVIGADGVQETWDLYINPIETLSTGNTGNHYIGSLPGWRAPGMGWVRYTSMYSAYMAAGSVGADIGDSRLSMAFLDWDGQFGGLGRAKSFLIFDHPFMTTGISDLYTPNEMGTSSFQKVTQTPMYGIEPWSYAGLCNVAYPNAQNPYITQALGADMRYAGGIDYYRCDPTTLSDIAGANATFGYRRTILGGQHICAPQGSAVRISTAAYNSQGNSGAAFFVGIDISLMMRNTANGWATNDYGIIGLDWPNASPPSGVRLVVGAARTTFRTGGDAEAYGDQRNIPAQASKAALLALTGSSTGYWQDTTNNKLWIRYAYDSVLAAKADAIGNWKMDNSIITLQVSP